MQLPAKRGWKKDEQRKRKKKAMDVHALNHPKDQWTKAHFKRMCLHTKWPGDPYLCSNSVGMSASIACRLLDLLFGLMNTIVTSQLVLKTNKDHREEQYQLLFL
jgi:hypothetical protein